MTLQKSFLSARFQYFNFIIEEILYNIPDMEVLCNPTQF